MAVGGACLSNRAPGDSEGHIVPLTRSLIGIQEPTDAKIDSVFLNIDHISRQLSCRLIINVVVSQFHLYSYSASWPSTRLSWSRDQDF